MQARYATSNDAIVTLWLHRTRSKRLLTLMCSLSLTTQGSAPGLIMEAWLGGLFVACVSNALAYEYVEVLSQKLSARRWNRLQPVVGTLLVQARFVPIYFSWRPMSPDPGDDHVIDCAMNAGVPVVTSNVRDFRLAAPDFRAHSDDTGRLCHLVGRGITSQRPRDIRMP
jgi:hypothetical protein